MKTWRERIVAARERGRFTEKDIRDANHSECCAVAEVSHGQYDWFIRHPVYVKLRKGFPSGHQSLGSNFPVAVEANDFDKAERILDLAEDTALAIKREAQP